jgi:hypothetical protein
MTNEELDKMTKEELCVEVRSLLSEIARMREDEPKLRRGFFHIIRGIAGMHTDKQGSVLWDAIEADLKKSDGLITPPTGRTEYVRGVMTAYPPEAVLNAPPPRGREPVQPGGENSHGIHEPIRVCKEHRDSFSRDCAVCKLEEARNELVETFALVSKCCEGPYSRIIFETYEEGVKRRQGPPLPEITQKEAMKQTLNFVVEIADTMTDRFGNPDGKIKPWPRLGSKGAA